MEKIGYVIGESGIQEATLLVKNENVRVGEYVVLEYNNKKILSLIISLTAGSPIFDDKTYDVQMVEQFDSLDKIPVYTKAKIKLLCNLNNLSQPDQPPPPLTPARLAVDEELRKFASNGDVAIGKLIGTNVEVKIDVNQLFKHLAILAATGSGKSNTVAVLSSQIAELDGTTMIFDYHGEYYESDIKKLEVIKPIINPLHLTASEFARLLYVNEKRAHIQYRLLRKTFTSLKEEIWKGLKEGKISLGELNEDSFAIKFEEYLEKIAKGEHGSNDKRVDEVMDKFEDFMDRYGSLINFAVRDITQRIKEGKVNVINISELADDSIADAVISHYLRRVLQARKDHKIKGEGLEYPIFTIIEEAHVFLSGRENTLTKEWAGRIAREGRKFGVGLVIVSQRPKGIDENILSQMTNKIILRIVEPSDQKYVLDASDNLTEDLVNSLASLDVGEALIIGGLTRIPLMVKIDKFEGKLGGNNPKIFKRKDFPPDMPGLKI